jgi:dimethylargininase
MTVALVRRTSSRLAEGLLTHLERQPVDIDLARRQWESYVDALRGVGWQVHEVPPLDSCADSVFVEDTVVMFRDVAVITRPGNDTRKPEVEAVQPVVESLGCRVERIVAPGTLDGGDVLKVNDTIYVGLGGRTNQEGIRQLAHILEPIGATVVTVPVTKVLHLKSAVTALPDGTIIGWDKAVDDPAIFPKYLSMPEESGAHVVIVDDKRLLMAADAPKSAELLESRGYETIRVDISEYIKLEGCVTCLSVRMRNF